LLERDDEALAILEKCAEQKYLPTLRLYLSDDPAYQRLRSNPRFRAVVEQVERYSVTQRQELDQMRAKGLIPHRSRG
jgi:hypothetical protein